MNDEGAFNLTLRRPALRSMSVDCAGNGECEVIGSIGEIEAVKVLENALLEVRGKSGTLRFSLPKKLLEAIDRRSKKGRESNPEKKEQMRD